VQNVARVRVGINGVQEGSPRRKGANQKLGLEAETIMPLGVSSIISCFKVENGETNMARSHEDI